MVKGEDSVRRKKNKLNRKKMRADDSSSKVSARVAAIIASKQRRKNGKRRMCEGMCFSLPTLEDPFNDKHGQKKSNQTNAQKPADLHSEALANVTQKAVALRKDVFGKQSKPQKDKYTNANYEKFKRMPSFSCKDQRNPTQPFETKNGMLGKGGLHQRQHLRIHGSSCGPSKFLTICLKAIQDTLLGKDTFKGNSEQPLLLNKWGSEFLACSLLGTDILETTGACSSAEQIAWMVSIAADIIAIKERESLVVATPFLLILVPTKEKAIQVRTLCKPLKALGILTVSLHTGASLDHQIQGLKTCEPEFLVSTPKRLLELVSAKAIDISSLSFLVVDGLESFAKSGLLDELKSIKQSIRQASLKVVFCDSFGTLSTSVVQTLLDGPITRLSLTYSIASESACISQCIHTCDSQEKPSKGIQILKEECEKRRSSSSLKVLFVEETSSKARILCALLIADGYSISNNTSDVTYSKEQATVTVTDLEHIEKTRGMEEFEIVVITSFPRDIDNYVQILTGMARQSVNGVLHSCICQEDAPVAGPLIKILELCDQTVPEFLRSCHHSISMSEH